MSEWISVDDVLPPEETQINTLYFDVWQSSEAYEGREISVKFKGGLFYELILDYQGDFSHEEVLENVTHWLLPKPPLPEPP